MRRSSNLFLIGLVAVLAACGSTSSSGSQSGPQGSPSGDAKAVLTSASTSLATAPVTVDGKISVSTVSAPPQVKSLAAKALDVKVHAQLSTYSNVTASLEGTVGDQPVNIRLAVSGGAQFISLDGGATWAKKTSVDGTPLNVEAVIEYLSAISTVVDSGDGNYQAQLNAAALTTFLKSSLTAAEPQIPNWPVALPTLTASNGNLTARVANKRITQYQGSVSFSLDGKQLDPAASAPLQLKEAFSFTFTKYGAAPATVTPPATS